MASAAIGNRTQPSQASYSKRDGPNHVARSYAERTPSVGIKSVQNEAVLSYWLTSQETPEVREGLFATIRLIVIAILVAIRLRTHSRARSD